MGILVPEIVLFNLIESTLEAIRVDFKSYPDERQTILYSYFGDLPVIKGKWNWFQQAKDLFLREDDHPRKMGTEMFFNSERMTIPTIHITLPSEMASADGIGIDEGYEDNLVDSIQGQLRPQFTRMFETQYQLIITSDNTLEVQLMYTVLRGMIIGLLAQFEFAGLRNMKLSGQDLRLDSSIVPQNLFTRSLGLRFQYEVVAPSFYDQQIFNSINMGIVTPTQI